MADKNFEEQLGEANALIQALEKKIKELKGREAERIDRSKWANQKPRKGK